MPLTLPPPWFCSQRHQGPGVGGRDNGLVGGGWAQAWGCPPVGAHMQEGLRLGCVPVTNSGARWRGVGQGNWDPSMVAVLSQRGRLGTMMESRGREWWAETWVGCEAAGPGMLPPEGRRGKTAPLPEPRSCRLPDAPGSPRAPVMCSMQLVRMCQGELRAELWGHGRKHVAEEGQATVPCSSNSPAMGKGGQCLAGPQPH